jgi:hypothetical protein
MITEIQAQIQTAAAVESLVNPIDQLAVIDRQIKALTEQSKSLKDTVANTYGEGKHRGEMYGATVSLYQTTTVDYKKLLADLGVDADTVAKYTKHNAVLRITVTA